MLIHANDGAAADLESCVRRGRAVYESSGAISAVVLGERSPAAGRRIHESVELSALDRRCLVIINVGPPHDAVAPMPAGPLKLEQVAPAAPALSAWPPRAPQTRAERPRRRRAREKVLDMYVRSGVLADDQARQTKRAKVVSESDKPVAVE